MNVIALWATLVFVGVSIGSGASYWLTSTYYIAEIASCNLAIEKGNAVAAQMKAEHMAKNAAAEIHANQVFTENEALKNESAQIINNLSDSVRLYKERQQHRVARATATETVGGADKSADFTEDTAIQNACVESLPEQEEIGGIAERCIRTTLDNCGIAK